MTELLLSEEPDDLSIELSKVPRFPKSQQEKELQEMTYSAVFEYALDYIAAGIPVTSILQKDPRNIDIARFLRWVNRDPIRKKRYEEAQEISAEILGDQMNQLSAIDPNSAFQHLSVEQMKFEFGKLKWMMSTRNKRKYGDTKHVEVSSQDMDEKFLDSLSSNDLKKMIVEQLGVDPDTVDLDSLDIEEEL